MLHKAAAFIALFFVVGCARADVDTSALATTAPDGTIIMLDAPSRVTGEAQTITVSVRKDGERVRGASVRIVWKMRGMAMDAATGPLVAGPDGTYQLRGFSFAMPGTWVARVIVSERGATTAAAFALQATE